MVSECCNSSASVIGEEFEVEKSATALGKAGEDILPAGLVLVAVGELDVSVFEGEFVFGEFFEADDDVVCGSVNPAAFGNEGGADSFELGIIEDAFFAALDVYFVACIEELLGSGGRD